ncbi:MAG: TIM barrel protein [Nanoarchaeota archaeon]|nr:TIM barrel protein [Nanoarchaeota archaeon]
MIRIGPAGTGPEPLKGMQEVKNAGLDAVELEFTYGVRMTNETAKEIGELNKKLGLWLSIHAPYYINLASEERQKIGASRTRILQSCERGHHMGAKYIVFHPAFYGKRSPEETYAMVSVAITKMQDVIDEKGWKVQLAPETTGKRSQFGSVEELLRLKDEHGCHLTVDFAHLLARHGSIDYDQVLDQLKGLKHIHAHFAGIEFGEKGERKHLKTPKEEAKKLLSILHRRKVDITIINESPETWEDAKMMKKIADKFTL